MTSVQSPVTDLTFLLGHAAHVLNTELTAAMESLGVMPRGFCVLSTAMDSELTQIQLAERCDLDKTTMVVTLDDLERQGLAERHPSPTDRRARIVKITDAGRDKVEQGKQIVAGIHEDVLGTLPAGEREAFLSALHRLSENRLATTAACDRTVRRRNAK
ncbi:MarR family winged helix-turn-helix transcriptional regulator [Actinocorallia longicatena]|uniref:MarR family winged helix-turn-helix transcriptional regulator n=1 Tax=Actinocorallia longicatena TaxID=111803 RepID=A0ABP6QCY3_9ACTN